jgi:hypothetical protein
VARLMSRQCRTGRAAAGPVGDAGGGDLLLGAGDAGRHGRVTDQEGAGGLGGGQPAQEAQRQRRLGFQGEAG